MCSRFLLSCGLLLAGCTPSITLQPIVVIDDSFAPSEMAGIFDALDAWERAVPQVHFRAGTLSHGVYAAARTERFADAIYIQRNEGTHDHSCPGWTDLGDAAVARTYRSADQEIICIDASYVNANKGRWRQVAMHEIGHALQLDHLPPPSVMAPGYSLIADDVTCRDKRAIATIWSLPAPVCE